MKLSVTTLLRRTCAVIAVAVFLLLASNFSATAVPKLSDTVVAEEVQSDKPKNDDGNNEDFNLRVTLMGFAGVAIVLIVTLVGRHIYGDGVNDEEGQNHESALPSQPDNSGDDSSYGPPASWPQA